MKDSEIALKSAVDIFRGEMWLSCSAIFINDGMEGEALCNEYAKLFCPVKSRWKGYWLGDRNDIEDLKEWRLTALCFFAAMLEAEGR